MKPLISSSIVSTALFISALAKAQQSPSSPTPNVDSQPANASVAPPAAAAPSTARAPADGAEANPSQASLANKERRGFLLRLQLGGGYRSASSGVGSTALDVSGTGFGGSLLAGGAVAGNLFLYGEVLAEYTSDPTIELGQTKVVANRASTRLVGFGPGLTYLMPQGMHLGGTLLLSRMTIERDDQELGATDTGFGFTARIGKDFWLGEHHALGLVGQFTFASMPDKSASPTVEAPSFSATAFTLAVSGTYN